MATATTPMDRGKGLDSSNNEPPLPHFFEIVVHPLHHGIMIPALFMRRHGKLLDNNAVFLRVPGGPEWKVELEVVNGGETWMKKGVPEFGEYYYIRKFHLLVFRYEGNSRFLVTIFDVSAAEIDYSFRSRVKSEVPEDVGPSRPPPPPVAPPQGPIAYSYLWGTEKLLACKRDFQSKSPFFACLLKPTNVTLPYTVHIPIGFMRSNFGSSLFKEKGWLDFALRVAGGKTKWHVLVYRYRMHGRIGSTGWKQIVLENGMKEGEVCIFELVKRENVFNVYRFR